MTRQNYYAKRKHRERKKCAEEKIIELVKKERQIQPRLGCRKVHYIIKSQLDHMEINVGRDRMFEILRKQGMLIAKKKAFIPKTTNSKHSLPVFRNLISDLSATSPNQIWVSDLTYIRTMEGFIYGALITDSYSRSIVGANAGDTLEAEGCIRALDQAICQLTERKYPIHHSDRGSQYCCHEYVKRLQNRGLSVSMTEQNHCYENAMAERVNGILKQEYGLDQEFKTKEQAVKAFYQAVDIYNVKRPHMSLGYRTPAEVHYQKAA